MTPSGWRRREKLDRDKGPCKTTDQTTITRGGSACPRCAMKGPWLSLASHPYRNLRSGHNALGFSLTGIGLSAAGQGQLPGKDVRTTQRRGPGSACAVAIPVHTRSYHAANPRSFAAKSKGRQRAFPSDSIVCGALVHSRPPRLSHRECLARAKNSGLRVSAQNGAENLGPVVGKRPEIPW